MSRNSKQYEPEDEYIYDDEEATEVSKETLLPRGMRDLPIDKRLARCTQALFFEFKHSTTVKDIPAPYTLKPYDWTNNGCLHKSMYLIYMECDSEYEAAMKLLGSWPHWNKLKKLEWFREELDKWNAEIELREQALARSKLIKLTEAGNVTAAKTLLAGTKAKAGRPEGKGKRKDIPVEETLEEMLKSTETAKQSK
jgi:hypothetical protein